jgi:protein TonB
MFEGTLVESRGLAVSGTQRWTALGSLTIQCAVAGLLLAIPLVRPEVLPLLGVAPQVELPLPVKPPVRVAPVRTASGPASAISAPATAAPQVAATRPFLFPRGNAVGTGDPVPSLLPLGTGTMGGGILAALSAVGSGPGPGVSVVRERAPAMAHVSGGVTTGLLLAPIRPAYPPIAKAAGVQGAVVMDAVISKAGRIESLRVLSGPAMLRQAAQTAVEAARYRPYLLSGVPTDVQTTITVVFTLGS